MRSKETQVRHWNHSTSHAATSHEFYRSMELPIKQISAPGAGMLSQSPELSFGIAWRLPPVIQYIGSIPPLSRSDHEKENRGFHSRHRQLLASSRQRASVPASSDCEVFLISDPSSQIKLSPPSKTPAVLLPRSLTFHTLRSADGLQITSLQGKKKPRDLTAEELC